MQGFRNNRTSNNVVPTGMHPQRPNKSLRTAPILVAIAAATQLRAFECVDALGAEGFERVAVDDVGATSEVG